MCRAKTTLEGVPGDRPECSSVLRGLHLDQADHGIRNQLIALFRVAAAQNHHGWNAAFTQFVNNK